MDLFGTIRRLLPLLCLFTALRAAAQAPLSFPPIDPDPQAAVFARGSGGHTWEDLAAISIWASRTGSPDSAGEDTALLMERIRAAAEECTAGAAAWERPGEYVLTFMHGKFLTSYSLFQTRMDTLLANGRYNCVSSAALYLILARAAGLEARGVMTKDHAFAAVKAGDGWIDVETTNSYGFDPGNRKDFHDQFGKVTGFAYVPAKNYRDRAFISPLELISLILSNRIAELEKAGHFAEAVPLAVNRYALLAGRTGAAPSSDFYEDPYKDMMNRIFNYGAALVNGGKEEDALRWAVYAGTRYPDEERWQEFIMAAVNNRLVKFFRQGETAKGREFLDANGALLSADNHRRLDALTTDAELTERVSGFPVRAETALAEAGAILDIIEDAEERALLDGNRVTELRTAIIGKTAEILAGKGGAADWPAAIAWLESALDRYGPNRRLEQALAAYRTNHGVEFHNRFAGAWNKKDFDGAKRILAEGLALYPDNRQLLTDKRTVEQREKTRQP
ncbi:MAG: transglutaminase family protein [Treponema sp.]|jgi:tetratricopeptide (TPR) repeat protein|nr:transglutaminase family protein [Treponema sp.]